MPTPLPAYCSICLRWFPSTIASGLDAQGVTITSFSMSCPDCEEQVPIVGGVYNAIGEVIAVVKTSNFRPDELKHVSAILLTAMAHRTSADRLRELISYRVPKASLLNRFITDGRNAPIALALLSAVLDCVSQLALHSLTRSDIQQSVLAALFAAKHEQPPEPEAESE